MIERKDNTWLQLDVCPSWRFPHSFLPLTLWLHPSKDQSKLSLFPFTDDNTDDLVIAHSHHRETGRCSEAELCCHAHPPPHIAILERFSLIFTRKKNHFQDNFVAHQQKKAEKATVQKKSRLRTVHPASSLLSKVHWAIITIKVLTFWGHVSPHCSEKLEIDYVCIIFNILQFLSPSATELWRATTTWRKELVEDKIASSSIHPITWRSCRHIHCCSHEFILFRMWWTQMDETTCVWEMNWSNSSRYYSWFAHSLTLYILSHHVILYPHSAHLQSHWHWLIVHQSHPICSHLLQVMGQSTQQQATLTHPAYYTQVLT